MERGRERQSGEGASDVGSERAMEGGKHASK